MRHCALDLLLKIAVTGVLLAQLANRINAAEAIQSTSKKPGQSPAKAASLPTHPIHLHALSSNAALKEVKFNAKASAGVTDLVVSALVTAS